MNDGKTFISVEVSDPTFEVDPENNQIVAVRFYQRYESNNHNWNGWKQQVWQETESGWKITYEGEE